MVLRGELDLFSARGLERALLAPRTARVDVDLAGVTFMDAAALRCLLRARDSHRAAGRRLRCVSCSPPVTRLLDLLGCHATLTR